MECKCLSVLTPHHHATGINRYIMECKYLMAWQYTSSGVELIDTLWNVNKLKLIKILVYVKELIDTLWNVNQESCLFVPSRY